MKAISSSVLAVLLGTAAFHANAAPNPAEATFEVRVTVQKACSVTAGAGSDIDFGTQDASAINLSKSSNISVTCSKKTAYSIGLLPSNSSTSGAGSMASADVANTDTVAYQLRSTSATGAPWGTTAGRVSGTGDGTTKSHAVFATIANGGVNVNPDTYKDTVRVQVTY